MSFFQFPKDTTSALIESTELVIRLQETIAAQAAVIERLCSVIVSMASETTSHYDRLELSRNGLAIPTDSKQILAEWLDSVLGETVGYIYKDSNWSEGSQVPVFKKPEIK